MIVKNPKKLEKDAVQNFMAGHNQPEHVEELSQADWKFLKVYVQAMDKVVNAGNYFPIPHQRN